MIRFGSKGILCLRNIPSQTDLDLTYYPLIRFYRAAMEERRKFAGSLDTQTLWLYILTLLFELARRCGLGHPPEVLQYDTEEGETEEVMADPLIYQEAPWPQTHDTQGQGPGCPHVCAMWRCGKQCTRENRPGHRHHRCRQHRHL